MIYAYDVISWVSALLMAALIWVLMSKERYKQRGHGYLAAFFGANLVLIVYFWILQHQPISLSGYVRYFFWSLFFLLGPLLYLYVCAMCKPDFKWDRRLLCHSAAMPVAAILGCIATFFYVPEAGTTSFATWISTALPFALHIWTAFYLIAIFVQLSIYDAAIRDRFSNLARVNLTWLTALIAVFVVHWLFDLAAFALYFLEGPRPEAQLLLSIFSIGILGIFSLATVIQSLRWPAPIAAEPTKKTMPEPPAIFPDHSALGQALRHCMQTQKPFLNPELTLEQLASQLGFPAKSVSRCLNTALKKNFFDFVNSYRLEEAKRLLASPGEHHKTISEILYAAGFNSKATFNRIFKQHLAMTPTQFRQQAKSAHGDPRPVESV